MPPNEPMLIGQSTIAELETLQLHCQVKGWPIPNIIWIKRSDNEVRVILSSLRINIISNRTGSNGFPLLISILYIHNITTMDSGEYVCEAENGIATTSPVLASLYINVTGKEESYIN